MFKFDFQPDKDDLNADFTAGLPSKDNVQPALGYSAELQCNEFEEIIPAADLEPIVCEASTIQFAHLDEILYLKADILIDMIDNRNHKLSLEASNPSHTDLIPGIYEGGGKIWECTQDLGDYLTNSMKAAKDTDLLNNLKDKYVLDLGCGAGILGILALKAGAYVHFHDYNNAVLSKLTIQNVLLNYSDNDTKDTTKNLELQNALHRSKFYAGDWQNYVQATAGSTFDLILSCETIYNPANNQKLLNTIKTKLRKNGVALLAAKTYYFGVGGGLRSFEKLIENDGSMQSKIVWVSKENVQREILQITHKS